MRELYLRGEEKMDVKASVVSCTLAAMAGICFVSGLVIITK